MKSVTTIGSERFQSIVQLWTPLPEDQQELLSGGAPKVSVSVSTTAGSSSLISTSARVSN